MAGQLPNKGKAKRGPDSVDLVIAACLRTFRAVRGFSQAQLGKEVGVSCQQIQKYEKGTNRIAASTLYHISRILDVSVLEFFAGLDGVRPKSKDIWLSDDEIHLLKTYRRITEDGGRRHAIKLVEDVISYRLDGDD